MSLVKECMQKANDLSGLLLLSTASGDAQLLEVVGAAGSAQGHHNLAFLSAFLRSDVERCLEILIETNRLPEAAFFARTYLPSQMSRIVELWREKLGKVNEKAGQSLADPAQYTNLFPGLGDALRVEQHLQEERARKAPARLAANLPLNSERHPLQELFAAEQGAAGQHLEEKVKPAYVPAQAVVSSSQVAEPTSAADDDDDLDLEIDGITLDDNIDTTDVNLDDDFLSDD
nr:GH16479p [Drosophila melanogaster]